MLPHPFFSSQSVISSLSNGLQGPKWSGLPHWMSLPRKYSFFTFLISSSVALVLAHSCLATLAFLLCLERSRLIICLQVLCSCFASCTERSSRSHILITHSFTSLRFLLNITSQWGFPRPTYLKLHHFPLTLYFISLFVECTLPLLEYNLFQSSSFFVHCYISSALCLPQRCSKNICWTFV